GGRTADGRGAPKSWPHAEGVDAGDARRVPECGRRARGAGRRSLRAQAARVIRHRTRSRPAPLSRRVTELRESGSGRRARAEQALWQTGHAIEVVPSLLSGPREPAAEPCRPAAEGAVGDNTGGDYPHFDPKDVRRSKRSPDMLAGKGRAVLVVALLAGCGKL